MQPTRIRDFVRAFFVDFRKTWFEALSGGFSIPFAMFGTALAFFTKNSIEALVGALAFWIMAFGGAWFASFQIWKIQKTRADALEQRLKPGFHVDFDPNKRGIVRAVDKIQRFHSMGASGDPIYQTLNHKANYLRLTINTSSDAPVKECFAYIVQLDKRLPGETEYTPLVVPQPIPLRDEPFDVKPGIPSMVDFIKTTEENVLSPVGYWPHALERVFREAEAIFRFTFKIHGDGVTADPIIVNVMWNGRWDEIQAVRIM